MHARLFESLSTVFVSDYLLTQLWPLDLRHGSSWLQDDRFGSEFDRFRVLQEEVKKEESKRRTRGRRHDQLQFQRTI